jgi:hypothetical protein
MKKLPLTYSLLLTVFFVLLPFNKGLLAEEPPAPLELLKQEVLPTGGGVKSLIMNSDSSNVYSINLEGMSVFEFDREKREIERKLVFIPHKGKGFNYKKNTWITSYQEKPVEACLTHNDRFLWISLHNAGGVAVWDLEGVDTYVPGRPFKEAWLYERAPAEDGDNPPDSETNKRPDSNKDNKSDFIKRKIRLLLIETGKTPKVITGSPDGKHLFVANWHSNSVSAIKIDSPEPEDWKKIKDFKPFIIPRGLAVSPDSSRLYIAQMGSNVVSAIDLEKMEKAGEIKSGANPRHIIVDGPFLYASLNKISKLVKIDPATGDVLLRANTCAMPRTIALSGDGKILFAACYRGNAVQAFSSDGLSLLGSWESGEHPVAVATYQKDDLLEAWVGNYTSGSLYVFTFKENPPGLLTNR